MEAEKLLCLRQVKDLTGLSMSSLIRLRKNNNFPSVIKLGKRIFVPLSQYQLWIKANTGGSSKVEDKNEKSIIDENGGTHEE